MILMAVMYFNPFDDIIELSVRNRYNTVYGLRIFAVRIIRRIYNSLLSHDFPLACCTVVFILFDLCRSYLKTDIENNMISILITEMFVVRDIVIMILGSKSSEIGCPQRRQRICRT